MDPAAGAQGDQGVPDHRGGGNPQVKKVDPGGKKTGDHRPLQRPGCQRMIGADHHPCLFREQGTVGHPQPGGKLRRQFLVKGLVNPQIPKETVAPRVPK